MKKTQNYLGTATGQRRTSKLWILVCAVILYLLSTRNSSLSFSTDHPKEEWLKIYEFVSPSQELKFLEPVDVKHQVKTVGYLPIDQVHRQEKIHSGAWVVVTDQTGDKVLLLKRGPQLVTCPNTWGLVGEHSNGDESAFQTVQRALVEELWGGSNQTYERDVAFVRSLTVHPLFFLLAYNNQRVDRQLTFLYEVRFRQPSPQIQLKLDDEVFDHQWINLQDLGKWIHSDKANHDFCHARLVQLNQIVLQKLLALREKSSQSMPT